MKFEMGKKPFKNTVLLERLNKFNRDFDNYRLDNPSKEKIIGREWLNVIITDWLKNTDEDYNIFWLQGVPGSGKSSFLKFFYNKLRIENSGPLFFAEDVDTPKNHNNGLLNQNQEYIVCSHFFKSDDIINSDPNIALFHIFLNILEQSEDFCLHHYKETRGETKVIINDFTSESNPPVLLLSRYLIDPLVSLKPCKKILIILDAIDEITEGNDFFIHRIIDQIQTNEYLNIKLLISSRNTPEYYNINSIDPYSFQSEDPRSTGDIQSFIENKLKNDLIGGRLDDRVLNQLVYSSAGNFLYLYYFCYLVKHDQSFNIYSSSYPKGLFNLYNYLFQSIFGTSKHELRYFKECIEPFLSVLCVSLRPILSYDFYEIIVKNYKINEFFDLNYQFIDNSIEEFLFYKYCNLFKNNTDLTEELRENQNALNLNNRIEQTVKYLKKNRDLLEKFKDELSKVEQNPKNFLVILIKFEITILKIKIEPFFPEIKIRNNRYVRPKHKSIVEWLNGNGRGTY